ncbi:MAG: metalloregulator ArsR/SmtB family transcription factor [Deltaproteobacteria bacterium]|jgi:ArsR family transcriptional regulator|nr:metalloregulator ArsR/SmtB family transcription factor [Deltaproteobacteria bacterium]
MVYKYCRFIDLGETLKALGHPVRLCIMNKLLENGPSNVATLQHCLHQPQSTISQHLKKLNTIGLINVMKNGLEHIYGINGELNLELINFIFDYNKKVKNLTLSSNNAVNFSN